MCAGFRWRGGVSGELDGVSSELDNCVCRLSLERRGER